MNNPSQQFAVIRTPDYRLRVFVSSTLKELAEEREAIRQAILRLRLVPVMFESGARPHPARNLYQAYLSQSHIFLGIYWQSYGWIAPESQISGLEDEYNLSSKMPHLIYIKTPAPERESALTEMLRRIRDENAGSYKSFSTANELRELAENDLALLLSESFEVSRQELRAEDIQQRPLTNVPTPRNSLIGRQQELEAACDLLKRDDVALVTLTGPGGAGKSRLAIQIALDLRDHFADGVFLVGLEALNDAELVIPTIAKTLGVTEGTGGLSLLSLLKGFLHNKEILLVLDNFEHILEAAPQIAKLVEAGPGVKMLVSSRARLHLRAEKELAVPPLALPPLGQIPDVEPLSQYSAVRLFIERAQGVRPDFEVTNENAPAVAEICHRLDGLPLAIELAAARIRMLSPQALLTRLSDRFEVLRGGARDLPERQHTLYGAIEWSYNLLGEEDKRLLRRLSVFADGWTFGAADGVCNAEGDEPLEIFEGLTRLIDNNLVKPPVEVNGELRLSALETIQEFAYQHLVESGEADAVLSRFAHYYLALAGKAESGLHESSQEQWLKRVEIELDNFRAAMDWTLKQDQPDIALRIASSLFPFWDGLGPWREGLRWLERGLAGTGFIPDTVRAKALGQTGWLTTHLDDYPRAIALLQESLALWRTTGDRLGIAKALNNLGLVVMYRGDYTRAIATLKESLDLWRQMSDPSRIYITLMNLGMATINLGLPKEAEEYHLEALEEARKAGDEAMIGMTLANLGEVYAAQGEYERADESYGQAEEILQRLGDRARAAILGSNRAIAALKQGDHNRAYDFLTGSLRTLLDMDQKDFAIGCLERLAILAQEERDPVRAVRLLSAGESLRKAIGVVRWAVDQKDYDTCLSVLQDELDPAAFTEALAAGSALSFDQAVAYALEPAGRPGAWQPRSIPNRGRGTPT